MRKKDYKLSKLKHGLYREKGKGKKEVIRKLTKEEYDYLSDIFKVEPFLYEVRMSFPPNFYPGEKPGVVKLLWYQFKKDNKYTVIHRMTEKDAKNCKKYGLGVKEIKYKITL